LVVVVVGMVVVVVGAVVVTTTVEVVVSGTTVNVTSLSVRLLEHAARRAKDMRSHDRRMWETIRPAAL
jgi:hypothetical protein